MQHRIFRWIFRLVGIVVALVLIGFVALYFYLQANHKHILQSAVESAGLALDYRDIDLSWWNDFPDLTLRLDSVVVRDTTFDPDVPPILAAESLQLDFSVAAMLRDTLRLKSICLANGQLHSRRGVDGQFNFGNLFAPRTASAEPSFFKPAINWSGMELDLDRLTVSHLDSLKRKDIELRIDRLRTTAHFDSTGNISLYATFGAWVDGITLNTDKGAYLTNSSVSGSIEVVIRPDSAIIKPTSLLVGEQNFSLSAAIGRGDRHSRIELSGDSVEYALTRPLLHAELRDKLSDYHVSGTFPVSATIAIDPVQPMHPKISVDFRLENQQVRAFQHRFEQVTTRGQVINRLSVAEGGVAGSRKNIKIILDRLHCYWESIQVRSPRAFLAGTAGDTKLDAPLLLTGPAPALSNLFGNRDFLFRDGSFELRTQANGSLNRMDDLIDGSDGQIHLTDVGVFYRPANTRLPFTLIELDKMDQDIQFRIISEPLPTGLSLNLAGTIDNLAPLLLDRPHMAVTSDVRMHAPRLNWTDLLSLFGKEGYLTQSPQASNPSSPESMRRTMLGLKQTFNPSIVAHFDTVAYYDLFTLTDFRTGVHFNEDTLVLKQTVFDWAGSRINLASKLNFGYSSRTPFQLSMHAEHLNLNRLRPTLDYFGLQLPRELDSLPADLSIDFNHQGCLDDRTGVVAGFNRGSLNFHDGQGGLFSGLLDYSPGVNGLQSQFQLEGDPQIVNLLFGAEDFFFDSGHFLLNLDLIGIPGNIRELILESDLRLQIDSSRVLYRPDSISLPLHALSLDVVDNHAGFNLLFFTDRTHNSVRVDGSLDDLSAFLLPEADNTFLVNAALSSPRLQWSDLEDLIQFETTGKPTVDPSSRPTFFSATKSIFARFQPELQIAIDTFLLTDLPPLTNIHTTLQLHDSLGLLLGESGFDQQETSVRFNGHYALDEHSTSPFALRLAIDQLKLEQLLLTGGQLGFNVPDDIAQLTGTVNLRADLSGTFDEAETQLQFQETSGSLQFQIDELALTNSEFLRAIGRKAMMKKRFEQLLFAPLRGELQLDSGRIAIPRLEIQNTGAQIFVEGSYDMTQGPDLLISIPLRNIGRGVLRVPPLHTGYAHSGWKIYLVVENDQSGQPKVRFRLGRRRYYRQRGLLDEYRAERRRLRAERRRDD